MKRGEWADSEPTTKPWRTHGVLHQDYLPGLSWSLSQDAIENLTAVLVGKEVSAKGTF